MHIDELTREIIGISIKIHRQLDPGLFESVYQAALQLTELDQAQIINYLKLADKPVGLLINFNVKLKRFVN